MASYTCCPLTWRGPDPLPQLVTEVWETRASGALWRPFLHEINMGEAEESEPWIRRQAEAAFRLNSGSCSSALAHMEGALWVGVGEERRLSKDLSKRLVLREQLICSASLF